jgi:hypothetical protein
LSPRTGLSFWADISEQVALHTVAHAGRDRPVTGDDHGTLAGERICNEMSVTAWVPGIDDLTIKKPTDRVDNAKRDGSRSSSKGSGATKPDAW